MIARTPIWFAHRDKVAGLVDALLIGLRDRGNLRGDLQLDGGDTPYMRLLNGTADAIAAAEIDRTELDARWARLRELLVGNAVRHGQGHVLKEGHDPARCADCLAMQIRVVIGITVRAALNRAWDLRFEDPNGKDRTAGEIFDQVLREIDGPSQRNGVSHG